MLSTKVSTRPIGSPKTLFINVQSSMRSRVVSRVAAPEVNLESLDAAERARLESTDAFAELVSINAAKQSVNKPQKVIKSSCSRWGVEAQLCQIIIICTFNAAAMQDLSGVPSHVPSLIVL